MIVADYEWIAYRQMANKARALQEVSSELGTKWKNRVVQRAEAVRDGLSDSQKKDAEKLDELIKLFNDVDLADSGEVNVEDIERLDAAVKMMTLDDNKQIADLAKSIKQNGLDVMMARTRNPGTIPTESPKMSNTPPPASFGPSKTRPKLPMSRGAMPAETPPEAIEAPEAPKA